jgi:hypothetical protein
MHAICPAHYGQHNRNVIENGELHILATNFVTNIC